MKTLLRWGIAVLALLPLLGYAAPKLPDITKDNAGKKIAVVSVSANNFGNSLQGWNKVSTSDLMATQLNEMLHFLEQRFADKWAVIEAETYVGKPEFQDLAGEQREVGLPKFGEFTMPLMSKNRNQLVKTQLDQDVAQSLAKATGADFLIVAYSEWGVQTGKWVPTTKPLAKNVLSVYSAEGKQVFFGRVDKVGTKTLGALGNVYVDEDTIGEWVSAFNEGIEAIYAGRKK